MTRETRRVARVVITTAHMVIQVLMLYIIITKLDQSRGHSAEQILMSIRSIITHASIMFGSFFIYFSIMQLVTRRNIQGMRGNSKDS